MSQNDFNLANQGFPSMRSDMNSAFQALATNSSGATAPSTTYAYQWWYDDANDILKFRNADNDAWIDFVSFNQATDSVATVFGTIANGFLLRGAPILITTSGTYTPDAAVKAVIVEVQGAGGAGGGASTSGGTNNLASGGGGGFSGGYAKKFIADPDAATITIGAGGTAVSGNNGNAGGNTVWSDGTNTITAPGGSGGLSFGGATSIQTTGTPPLPDAPTGGDINVRSTSADVGMGFGLSVASVPVAIGAAGASSKFGAGGRVNRERDAASAQADGFAGVGYGAGGSGAAIAATNTASRPGGVGAPGIVVIWEFI